MLIPMLSPVTKLMHPDKFVHLATITIIVLLLMLPTTWEQNLKNVALRKPALGDSMYSDTSISQPRYAVDGRTQTDVWYYTCFHSSDYWWLYNPHWWIVDLLQDFTIWEVIITNRNIHPDRLSNFTVDIFTGPQDPRSLPNWPMNFGTVCHHQDAALLSSETRTFPCQSPTRGRYLRVVKYSYTSLVMCEVQVMADVQPVDIPEVTTLKHQGLSLSGTLATNVHSRLACAVKCSTTSLCNMAQWSTNDNSCNWYTYSKFTESITVCDALSTQAGSDVIVYGSQDHESC